MPTPEEISLMFKFLKDKEGRPIPKGCKIVNDFEDMEDSDGKIIINGDISFHRYRHTLPPNIVSVS